MRFAACLCLALSAWAAPGPSIPNTPAGNVLTAWLDAFNSGDRARFTSYLAKYEPDHQSAVDGLMIFAIRQAALL